MELSTLLVLTALLGPAQEVPVALLGADRIELLERGKRRLVAGTEGAESFAWDFGGEHLLVTRGGTLERVAVATAERRVLVDGWRSIRMPNASPDGAHIAFCANAEDDPARGWQVVLLERAGGTTRMLSDGYDPCFSRDGTSVLFERYPDRDVWRVDLLGDEPERVFETVEDRYTVEVDPYGERVAFSSEGRLLFVDACTGETTSPSVAGDYDRFPSFAHDRRHVLFFRQRNQPADAAFEGIVELDLLTGEERELAGSVVRMAAYAPRSLPDFEEHARAARGERTPAEWLPVSADRDPALRRWLLRDATEGRASHLFLPGVTRLAPVEAAVLATYPGRTLSLPDLVALDAATARALAAFPGRLLLDGIASLDAPTALALASWSGNGEQLFLSLDGLDDPSDAVLGALGTCRGWGLSLDGLTSLSVAGARALGPVHVATLELDGLHRIDRPLAKAIADWGAKYLSLLGWRDRPPELEALVERGCAVLFTR